MMQIQEQELRWDYPQVPTRDADNPYWECAHCNLSGPHINGAVDGHADYCAWRAWVENGEEGTAPCTPGQAAELSDEDDLTWEFEL